MHIAPAPLTSHPMTPLRPKGARLTGSMKIAPPMIVPTTSAVVIQIPILPSFTIVTPPPEADARAYISR